MRGARLHTADDRALRALGWCLRVGIVLQSAALAHVSFEYYSPVNAVLFQSSGLSVEAVRAVDLWAAGIVSVAALVVAVRPNAAALGVLAAWAAAVAACTWLQGGDPFAHLAPAAQAARYAGPVALALIATSARRPVAAWRVPAGVWTLRLALAATFAAHGIEALEHAPRFVDLVIGAGRRLLDVRIDEGAAETMLTAIGVVDLVVAALVLVRPWPGVALYMSAWGVLTAASRFVHSGTDDWDGSLLRALNGLAPLGLLLYWRRSRARSEPK